MKVRLNDVVNLFASNKQAKITLRTAVDVDGKKMFPPLTRLTKKDVEELDTQSVTEIDIIYTKGTLVQLNSVNPVRYRRPYATETPETIRKITKTLESVSRQCERKRALIMCEEVYRDPEKQDYSLVVEYGETISAQSWRKVKKQLDPNKSYAYRPNEVGIIVLIDLRPRGEDYLRRFYKNSDLITTLTGKGNEKYQPIPISPDLVRARDIHSVDNYRELLDTYKKTDARLIIVGDALSVEYKTALGQIKKYDKYARFMLAANIDHTNKDNFFRQIALNYHRNPWQTLK